MLSNFLAEMRIYSSTVLWAYFALHRRATLIKWTLENNSRKDLQDCIHLKFILWISFLIYSFNDGNGQRKTHAIIIRWIFSCTNGSYYCLQRPKLSTNQVSFLNPLKAKLNLVKQINDCLHTKNRIKIDFNYLLAYLVDLLCQVGRKISRRYK